MSKYELHEALTKIRQEHLKIHRPAAIELSKIKLKNSLTGMREINKSQLQSFEDGYSKNPSWITLTALLEVYGITPTDLLMFMHNGKTPDFHKSTVGENANDISSYVAKVPLYDGKKGDVFEVTNSAFINSTDPDYDFAFVISDEVGNITAPGVKSGSIAFCQNESPVSGNYVCVHRMVDNHLLMYRYVFDGTEINLIPIYDMFATLVPNDEFKIIGVVKSISNLM